MSKTTRSRRGRCIALAAVTAGVSWLTTGPAMAGPSMASDSVGATIICQPPTGNTQTGNTLSGNTLAGRAPAGFTALAPATGVLSITDAAGAAAGQGMHALPGRAAVAPQPGHMSVAPAITGLAPAGSGAVLPAAKAPAAPILDAMPARPGVADAVCLPTTPMAAARTHPRPQERLHPISRTNPKRHRHPKPAQSQQPGGSRAQEGTTGTLSGSGVSGTSASGNRGATGVQTGAETARRPNGHAAGHHRANQRTGVNPHHRNRGERRAADLSQTAGQSQAVPPRQQEGVNQTATGGQRGTAQTSQTQTSQTPTNKTQKNKTQTGKAQTGTGRNSRHHRQHPGGQANQGNQTGQAGQAAASTATGSATSPRRVKREGRVAEEARVYPKATNSQQDTAASGPGDITAPALPQSTGASPLIDLAGSAGRKLLP